MTTIWQNETKRQIGQSTALMDDPVITMDSNAVLFGAYNPPTVWTSETKTS